MTTIYFIRHAHSTYTLDEYNRPLSENGRFEAEKLVKLFEEIEIHAMYASNYLRASETIQPIAQIKDLTIEQMEQLNERVLSATPVDDFEEAIQKVWNNPTFHFPGGESNIEAQNRVIPAIEELIVKHQDETIIIGTHGNIFTLILNYYDAQYGLAYWNNLKMPDVIEVVFEGGQLISVNNYTDLSDFVYKLT